MTQGTTLEDELSDSCQRALEYLRDKRPEAKVVAVQGNDWAYVSVGQIAVATVTDVFEQEEAVGIVRIPTDFPNGRRPYGLITIPYLERSDGQAIPKQDRHEHRLEPVEEALDPDSLGFWSWKWRDLSSSDEADLQKAPEMFRERLRKE